MSFKLLKELSEIPSISSNEYLICDYIKDKLNTIGYKYRVDGLNSVIAYKENNLNSLKFMIATHVDEIGFIVKSIDDSGFIKMEAVGSWWSHLVMGQLMEITTSENKRFLALVGSLPTHGIKKEVKERTIDLNDLYLDLGVSGKESVLKLGINIGDMITPYAKTQMMNEDGYVISKAFDNRISTYILMRFLEEVNNKNNIFGAFTTQEEVGLRGARTTTNMIKPDIAFAIDTTLAGDTPLTKNICKLNGGVVLSMIDSNSIAPRKLIRYLESLCEKNNIKYQYAVFNGGGTDSGNIHKSLDGILNLTLSIPIRYMHSNYSMVNLNDVEECIKLLLAINEDITLDKIEELI